MLKRKKKSKFTTEEIKTEIFNEPAIEISDVKAGILDGKCPLAEAMHIEEPRVVEPTEPEVVEIVKELSPEEIRALKRQAALDAQK